eukprot:5539496-Alexandrium_andersonii.AAC.1
MCIRDRPTPANPDSARVNERASGEAGWQGGWRRHLVDRPLPRAEPARPTRAAARDCAMSHVGRLSLIHI